MKKAIKLCSLILILILCLSVFISCSDDFFINPNNNQDESNDNGTNDDNQNNKIDNSNNIDNSQLPQEYTYTNFGEMIDRVIKGAIEINVNSTLGTSSGSGFLIGKMEDNDPVFITNYHVIQDALTEQTSEIKIKLADKAEYYSKQAQVLGYDEDMDIAVLTLDKEISDINNRIMEWGNSKAIYRGQEVYAIGNALGYETSLTRGIVSITEEIFVYDDKETAYEGDDVYKHVIRHDASINSGNSGGMLINADGQIIGINSYGYLANVKQVIGDTTDSTNYYTNAENMSLAIPSNLARAVYEYITVNYKGTAVDASAARKDFNSVLRLVNAVLDENEENNILKATQAVFELKLQANDIISAVNDIDVDDMFFDNIQIISPSILLELSYYCSKNSTDISNELRVSVSRNGEEQEITTGYYLSENLPVWFSELPFLEAA